MLPERELFLFLIRAFAILIKQTHLRSRDRQRCSAQPLCRDGDVTKQLVAYHLDIDWPLWSIRNRKNFVRVGRKVGKIAELEGNLEGWYGDAGNAPVSLRDEQFQWLYSRHFVSG